MSTKWEDFQSSRDEVHDSLLVEADRIESRPPLFPEIKGLCRTCKHSFIRQREHGDRPDLFCTVSYDNIHRVPPDIMKCSEYSKRGVMSLRDMTEQALLIDTRDGGGQYL